MMNDLQLMYFINTDLATATNSGIVDMAGYPRSASNPLRLVFALNDTPAGGTAVKFEVQTSDTVNFASPTTAYTSPVISTTTVTAPSILLQIHPVPSLKRYSRVVITKTGTFTAGKVSVFMTMGEDFPIRALEVERGWA